MSGLDAPLLPSLVGPTASGKTAVAIDVARRLAPAIAAEIVVADSRQVYRGLEAGTAKPTAAERAAVAHHLVDAADPRDPWSAARFAREARRAFGEIRARGAVPLLVGGSGLWLRAAVEGLFEGPAADEGLRARLAAEADRLGEGALHGRLAAVDPETAARLHPHDRFRVLRALEVHELTGIPLSEHHRRHRAASGAERLLRFLLDWPPALLARRIAERVDAMLAAGWEDEVRRLRAEGLDPASPALRALGYPEVAELVDGRIDRAGARERIVAATRRFAKRQRTWFRAVEPLVRIRVAGPGDLPGAAETVARAIRAALGDGGEAAP